MTIQMTRRHFLKDFGFGAAGMLLVPSEVKSFILPPEIVATEAAANLLLASPKKMKVAYPPEIVPSQTIAASLIQFLGQLAFNTASDLLANTISDGLSQLTQNANDQAEDANSVMNGSGFTQLVGPMYVNYNLGPVFYGAQLRSQANLCATVVKPNGYVLVEGPFIMALRNLAQDVYLRTNSKEYAGKVAIPLGDLANGPADFWNSAGPYIFTTDEGEVETSYTAYPRSNEGTINVTARRHNGGLLLDEEYDIELV